MTHHPASHQITLERTEVDQLYRRLDQKIKETRDTLRDTRAAEVEGPQGLFERDAQIDRLHRRITEHQAAEQRLCFGRLDKSTGESLRIGRIGLRDAAGKPILIDWRADAARPFYAATVLTPYGLRRRRHLRLQGRTVVGVSDELLDGSAATDEDLLGDGPLAEALTRARTGRMKEAVTTLQSEQDTIVRSSHRGVTVVQGGPGTGKTIVALHRAAYLLFASPSLAARGVLICGPNRRFLDYIGDVLPSLGESQVDLVTTDGLAGAVPRLEDAPETAARKGSGDMAADLAALVRRYQPHGVPLTVPVGSSTLSLEATVIDRARSAAIRDAHAHNPARRRFTEYVADALVNAAEQHATETLDTIDAEVSSVLSMDLDRAAAGDLRRMGFDDAPPGSGQPEFDREAMRSSLLDDPGLDEAIERLWPQLDPLTVLQQFLTERFPDTEPGCAAKTHDGHGFAERPASDLSSADIPLLDEARELIDGAPERVYGHVVVDEAQELTEMQWRMLMRRCPARSMTVVGDLAQRGSASTLRDWETALRPYVGDQFELHTLTVNYRTTSEILQASAPLLTEIAPDQQLSRSLREGDRPRRLAVEGTEIADAAADLARQMGSEHTDDLIGIVCPSHWVGALQNRAGETAVVVAAAEVRGVEFDTAIVVDPTGIRAERKRGSMTSTWPSRARPSAWR